MSVSLLTRMTNVNSAADERFHRRPRVYTSGARRVSGVMYQQVSAYGRSVWHCMQLQGQ